MSNKIDYEKMQGHWILAKMGKRVLRPGGKELTLKLIDSLHISAVDDIVEFAPGIGYTASMALKSHPKTYVGVDQDKDAIKNLRHKIKGHAVTFMEANAAQTGIPSESKSKVFGEAMLTMHADHRKAEIIREAHRILKKGGLYAIHELGLTPDNLSAEEKAAIQKDLAQTIKVNARPLTKDEWKELLEKEGFAIKHIETSPMLLLETGRIMNDEGFFRTLKIGMNVLLNASARKQITKMRGTFRKYENHMNAIAITAEKL